MSTIVALSTPPGRSAIAVIRISGPDSLRITGHLIHDKAFEPKPREVTLRTIRDPDTDGVLDHVLVTFMPAPNSFTGEDLVEISCHGSPIIVRRIIDLVLLNGGVPAEPGEFSLRAVANGKLDLSQAEAIRDLIDAQTDAAARQAVRQLGGELSARLQPIKDRLIEVIVRLESAVEFVEDDLPDVQGVELGKSLKGISSELEKLVSSYSSGHWLRDGIKVTIAGLPNVGKSSLFNNLLNHDRAIVTSVPGTTRDTLSETINIRGVPVSLTDTAGMRSTSDPIESIGIERANRAIADADLVLFIVDGSVEATTDEVDLFSRTGDSRYLVVANKCDLPKFQSNRTPKLFGVDRVVDISALRGDGLDQLCEVMLDQLGVRESDGDLLITDARHHDLLQKSRVEIESAILALENRASEELVLVGLHNALTLLGAITGETTTEDILNQIFMTFCIGK
jgi:tRNA modification GTPase